jgi:hypothetical protein
LDSSEHSAQTAQSSPRHSWSADNATKAQDSISAKMISAVAVTVTFDLFFICSPFFRARFAARDPDRFLY